jgi:hypothetical protein
MPETFKKNLIGNFCNFHQYFWSSAYLKGTVPRDFLAFGFFPRIIFPRYPHYPCNLFSHVFFENLRKLIHEHKISLSYLRIILRVLRIEVSIYNVYITNQFQPTFAQGRGEKSVDC